MTRALTVSIDAMGGDAGPSIVVSALLKTILPQIVARLGYLQSVGLDYLRLDRPMSTLSSGEAHRV